MRKTITALCISIMIATQATAFQSSDSALIEQAAREACEENHRSIVPEVLDMQRRLHESGFFCNALAETVNRYAPHSLQAWVSTNNCFDRNSHSKWLARRGSVFTEVRNRTVNMVGEERQYISVLFLGPDIRLYIIIEDTESVGALMCLIHHDQ